VPRGFVIRIEPVYQKWNASSIVEFQKKVGDLIAEALIRPGKLLSQVIHRGASIIAANSKSRVMSNVGISTAHRTFQK
jgi:hypothetical protein